jgi:hypothetical protein
VSANPVVARKTNNLVSQSFPGNYAREPQNARLYLQGLAPLMFMGAMRVLSGWGHFVPTDDEYEQARKWKHAVPSAKIGIAQVFPDALIERFRDFPKNIQLTTFRLMCKYNVTTLHGRTIYN